MLVIGPRLGDHRIELQNFGETGLFRIRNDQMAETRRDREPGRCREAQHGER
jgi:hypothetical protein